MKQRRVKIAKIIQSRYEGGIRPMSWDARTSGLDIVQSVDGEAIRLLSSGQQSTAQQGWEILLTNGDAENGYTWTLYGLSPNAVVSEA